MFTAPVDATFGEAEWRPFLTANPFGHLIAPGRDRELPVVVPTQFVYEPPVESGGDGAAGARSHHGTVWLHLVRANPIFAALAENPRVLLSVAGDWAFIPSDWKVIGDEDPLLGIPTTYYGAVQLAGTAQVVDERTEPGAVASILRRQLATLEPGTPVADPAQAHGPRLLGILGVRIEVERVDAKFKYGGNVDGAHRLAVVDRLHQRDGPGDAAAAAHVVRRLGPSEP